MLKPFTLLNCHGSDRRNEILNQVDIQRPFQTGAIRYRKFAVLRTHGGPPIWTLRTLLDWRALVNRARTLLEGGWLVRLEPRECRCAKSSAPTYPGNNHRRELSNNNANLTDARPRGR